MGLLQMNKTVISLVALAASFAVASPAVAGGGYGGYYGGRHFVGGHHGGFAYGRNFHGRSFGHVRHVGSFGPRYYGGGRYYRSGRGISGGEAAIIGLGAFGAGIIVNEAFNKDRVYRAAPAPVYRRPYVYGGGGEDLALERERLEAERQRLETERQRLENERIRLENERLRLGVARGSGRDDEFERFNEDSFGKNEEDSRPAVKSDDQDAFDDDSQDDVGNDDFESDDGIAAPSVGVEEDLLGAEPISYQTAFRACLQRVETTIGTLRSKPTTWREAQPLSGNAVRFRAVFSTPDRNGRLTTQTMVCDADSRGVRSIDLV